MQHFRSLLYTILALLTTAATTACAAGAEGSAPSKGDVPPNYAGRQLDGADVSIEPGDGKAYVISFWASWCGPCLQELPVLVNIQRIAGPEKMRVIAVNIEDRDVYRKLERQIRDLGLTSTFDPNGKAQETYRVKAIPHMIIVGNDGRISSVRKGYAKAALEDLAADLNQALAAAGK